MNSILHCKIVATLFLQTGKRLATKVYLIVVSQGSYKLSRYLPFVTTNGLRLEKCKTTLLSMLLSNYDADKK